MVDLTSKEFERKGYVTGIKLSDDAKTFTVTYADGHQETKEFDSVHNFNVYVHLMVGQYYKYEEPFKDTMRKWLKETVIKGVIELVLAIEGIILTLNNVPNNIIKIALISLIGLLTAIYQTRRFRELVTVSFSMNYLEELKKFVDIQEKLKVPVTDPKTGREDEWYLANLSEVGLATDVKVYEHFAQALEKEEIRKEEGMMLTKALKGE